MLLAFKPILSIFVSCMYCLFFLAHRKRFQALFGEHFHDFVNDMHEKMPYFGFILFVILVIISFCGGILLSLWVLVLFASWGVLARDTYEEMPELDANKRLIPLLVVILTGFGVASFYL